MALHPAQGLLYFGLTQSYLFLQATAERPIYILNTAQETFKILSNENQWNRHYRKSKFDR